MRPLTILRTSLALLPLLAAGCGHVAAPTGLAPAALAPRAASETAHKSGFDWARYQANFAKQEGESFPRTQALLPTRVDQRTMCPPAYDQKFLSSCTAFATVKGMREFLQRKNGERQVPLSALFEYYEARAGLPVVGPIMKFSDMGTTVTESMAVLKEKGAAPDELWPYQTNMFAKRPPKDAYAAAGEFKVQKTMKLRSFDDVKTALATGHCVAFGFQTRSNFDKIGADGMMAESKWTDMFQGAHAVLAVGYDDGQQRLIVRNSYGPNWGDHGYFYMPYKVAQQKLLATDFWTAE